MLPTGNVGIWYFVVKLVKYSGQIARYCIEIVSVMEWSCSGDAVTQNVSALNETAGSSWKPQASKCNTLSTECLQSVW